MRSFFLFLVQVTSSSWNIFFPVPNTNLIFWVIQPDHFNRIVAENGQLVAENSFNIIWRRNDNEGAFGWAPFEEQSWYLFAVVTWFFILFMILDKKLSLYISQYWRFQEFTCLLDKSLKIVTSSIFLFSSWIFVQFFLFNSFIPAYIHSNFPSFVFFSA